MRAGSWSLVRGAWRALVLLCVVAGATGVGVPSASADLSAPRPVGASQFSANDGKPSSLATSPDGTLVAVADETQPGSVSLFAAASTSPLAYAGGFRELPGSPTATGGLPTKLAFNPAGTLLAVANSGSSSVSVYRVDPTNAAQALTPVAGSPFSVSGAPRTLAFSADGTILAVPGFSNHAVSLFTVSAAGTLTPATGSPFAVSLPASDVVLDTTFVPGGYLAVASGHAALGTNGTGAVSMFAVANPSDPSLTAVGSPVPTQSAVADLTVDPAKKLLAALGLGNSLFMFSFGGSGNLTPTTGSPLSVGGTSALTDGVQFSPGGSMLAISDGAASSAGTTIDLVADDGSLTHAATITPLPGDEPQSVAWAPQSTVEGEDLIINTGAFQAYTVGPFMTIATPGAGAIYAQGQTVAASYACAGLTAVPSCSGTVPVGASIPTGAPGAYQFAVTGKNVDGFSATVTSGYTVSAAPASPCSASVSFQLTEVTGCLTHTADGSYSAGGVIRLNGILIAPASGSLSIVPGDGSGQYPGGFISATDAQIVFGSAPPPVLSAAPHVVYRGAIAAALPAGGPGMWQDVTEFPATPTSVVGFPVAGGFALAVGRDRDGTPYSLVTLPVELPPPFTAADGTTAATAEARVRVDDDGTPRYDEMTVVGGDLSLGSLTVDTVCFALIPAGAQSSSQCATPPGVHPGFAAANGVLDCNAGAPSPMIGAQGDRWVSTVELALPTPTRAPIALFGAGIGARFSYLNTKGTGLATALAPGVTLDALGAGICFPTAHQPLAQLEGDADVSLLATGVQSPLTIAGTVLATDASPATLQIGGPLSAGKLNLGTGELQLRDDGSLGLSTTLQLNAPGLSLTGNVDGQLDADTGGFGLEGGGVTVCVAAHACAKGDAFMSPTEATGCITVGSGPLAQQVGASYSWATGKTTVMGPYICDVGAWGPVTPIVDGSLTHSITAPAGTRAVALRIFGRSAPPVVRIAAPGVAPIVTPATGGLRVGKNSAVVWDIAHNAITVFIRTPQTGGTRSGNVITFSTTSTAKSRAYTAHSAAAANPITAIQIARVLAPFTGHGVVVAAHGGRRRLTLRYLLPTGATLSLAERSARAGQTLVNRVRGTACPGPVAPVIGGRRLCFTTTFTPAAGPGGVRSIVATVSQHGRPIKVKIVARYRAPKLAAPIGPTELQLRRSGTTVTVAWTAGDHLARYGVALHVRRELVRSAFVGAGCRAIRVTGVSPTDPVSAAVAAIRFDGRHSRARTASLVPGGPQGGSRGKRLTGKVCR